MKPKETLRGMAFRAVSAFAALAALTACSRAKGIPRDFKPAERTRFLDPYTKAVQTDDPEAGKKMSSSPGFWPVPCGQMDPLAKKPVPRVIYTVFEKSDTPFEGYDTSVPSPLFKVNQVGYLPDFPKFAYMGAWLGPEYGPWKPKNPPGPWRLADAKTGKTVFQSPSPPVLRIEDRTGKEGAFYTGEETYEMDFSQVKAEGAYYVEVPGVGRSDDFRISAAAAEEAFRVHMGGLYQKRCGIAKTEPWTHWTGAACHTEVVRGNFPPEEGELKPKCRMFDIIRHNTDWERGERIHAPGGWHDAADYDRRPMHLYIVNELCAVYLAKPGNFRDGQLAIPESSNGIPDILDEAEWGLRHILACQQADGGAGTWIETTGHPAPGSDPAKDPMRYAVSRATRRSSLAYAAAASLLARCHPAFRAKYAESARRAWDFAMRGKPESDVFAVKGKGAVEWKASENLPPEHLLKAAINLHALTGDMSYLEKLREEYACLKRGMDKYSWKWRPLSFTGERVLGYPDRLDPQTAALLRRWDAARIRMADALLRQTGASYAYRVPWPAPGEPWVGAMSFGASHPLVRAMHFAAAHAITGDRKYLEGISLAADFHNGCNPQGTTLTSGLGKTYPVAFLDLPSYVDGIAEYVPGITPYRWTYAVPWKAVETVFGKDRKYAGRWPVWRRWGNVENLTVEASEYTVWETIAPAAAMSGYMIDPKAAAPAGPRPKPAGNIQDLPGYWVLP